MLPFVPLISIEVYGDKADVAALQKWLPGIEDVAVKDRVQFTLLELAHRLLHCFVLQCH